MRVAVVGLGAMGSAIAGRLLDRGHSLRVWNRTPSRGEELEARGAVRGASPADTVRDVEVAITSLADDAAVRAVVTGEDGIAATLGPSAALADASTVAPQTSRALAEAVHGRFVDAPILGAPTAVASGQATVLLGGDASTLDRLEPLFADVFATRLRCGPVGFAATAKVVANLLLLGQLAVLAEAVASAQANGLSDELLAALGRTPLVAPALHNRLDDVIHGDHDGWFATRLGHKDVHLARTLAACAGLDLGVAAAVDSLYERTIAEGLGERDVTAIVEAVRMRRATAGV